MSSSSQSAGLKSRLEPFFSSIRFSVTPPSSSENAHVLVVAEGEQEYFSRFEAEADSFLIDLNRIRLMVFAETLGIYLIKQRYND